MSRFPPSGPKPPYYTGYPTVTPTPGYPIPGAFTYFPAPVMMPVYPPHPPPPDHGQPTYITNHIYQQPQPPASQPQPLPPIEPVRVVEDSIEWVPSTPTTMTLLTHRALVAGREGWDGSPLWVIRAHHSGELVPGKLAAKHRSAYIPHSGKEIAVHNFQVLCAPSHVMRWLPSSNGNVPVGALPAGNTHNGEPLYIGRAKFKCSLTPGKVHPSHGCVYVSFEGYEIPFKEYEVLCKFVG